MIETLGATMRVLTYGLIALFFVSTPVAAKGLNCELARQAERTAATTPVQSFMRKLSDIRGLGLLSEWTVETLSPQSDSPGRQSSGEHLEIDWAQPLTAHPFVANTTRPRIEIWGSLHIEERFGRKWLIWDVDHADPCEGRTDLPVHVINGIIRIDLDVLHQAVMDGVSLGGSNYQASDRQALRDLWLEAEPVLASVQVSRKGNTCRLTYETPERPVTLKFFCAEMKRG